MRTISLPRPWPWSYTHADNRVVPWPEAFDWRGEVAFVASKKFDAPSVTTIQRMSSTGAFGFCSGVPSMHPSGVLAFVADVIDSMPVAEVAERAQVFTRHRNPAAPFWHRQFGWCPPDGLCLILENLRVCKPVPVKDGHGLFYVWDDTVRAALRLEPPHATV